MMSYLYRLSPLHMGITRHDMPKILSCQRDKSSIYTIKQLDDPGTLFSQVHLEIKCYLIIPAACAVQLRSCRTDTIHQLLFDIHMNIFQLWFELKGTRVNFPANLGQTGHYRLQFTGGEYPLIREHRSMGFTAGNIIFI